MRDGELGDENPFPYRRGKVWRNMRTVCDFRVREIRGNSFLEGISSLSHTLIYEANGRIWEIFYKVFALNLQDGIVIIYVAEL